MEINRMKIISESRPNRKNTNKQGEKTVKTFKNRLTAFSPCLFKDFYPWSDLFFS